MLVPDLAALPVSPTALHKDAPLRAAARELEAAFLAEMLKSAGFGATRETFGGGAGEDQFSSFLRQAQAQKIVEAGGVGLAENLFKALSARIKADR